MNSEELELSLRTEFENYLDGVLSGMKQEIAEFQKEIDTEFDKHKSQLDEAFQHFSARFDADKVIDAAFKESVVEHLRLARDEGAEIAATAMAKAEAMEDHSSTGAGFGGIGDAIKDISSKTSQAAILEALVRHAERFTPRGVFFIIRNEHFVGWQVFGKEARTGEQQARDVHFPVSSETILADSVKSLGVAVSSSGKHAEDSLFLDSLGFGNPERMYAVPLVARGRGVAVLYADSDGDEQVDIDALEALVRVASLTVELRASSQGTKPRAEAIPAPATVEPAQEEFTEAQPEAVEEEYSGVSYEAAESEAVSEPAFVSEEISAPVEAADETLGEEIVQEEIPVVEEVYAIEADEVIAVAIEDDEAYLIDAGSEDLSSFEPTNVETETAAIAEETSVDFEYSAAGAAETAEFQAAEIQEEEQEDVAVTNGNGRPAAEPVVEISGAQPARSGLSSRHVNLPIEVADEERRFHNDARRFARLLVSEIKLYNEQKVREGLEASDLYDRLREAIDRSREMYDKRVQPPVASKFDYFHYELVGALAEGDEKKLGGTYPGAHS